MDGLKISETKCNSNGKDKTKYYTIKNNCGQQVFSAQDTSGDGLCKRVFFGNQRGFEIYVLDSCQNPVMRISRERRCCTGCRCFAMCDHCAMEVTIEAPVGHVVGYVRQAASFFKQQFEVLDECQQPVLRLEGLGSSIFGCCFNKDYRIWTADKSCQIGIARNDKSQMQCNL